MVLISGKLQTAAEKWFTAAKTSLAHQKSLGLLVVHQEVWPVPCEFYALKSVEYVGDHFSLPGLASGQLVRLQIRRYYFQTIPYHIQMIGITRSDSKDAVRSKGGKKWLQSSRCFPLSLLNIDLWNPEFTDRRFQRSKVQTPQQKHGLLKMGESENGVIT